MIGESLERIPVAGPWVTELEVRYVSDAAANGWYGGAGTYLQRFEQQFAEYLGVRHAIALPHCTAAIHLSLSALGIGPGDEVIVPELTWIATSAPISYVGATAVFADVDPRTWCLSVDSVRQCLTPRTKAILPVDLYGLTPEMDALHSLARERGVAIVEDAAQAIGCRYRGRPAGSLGDVGTFSFHGTKTLTTGEGGMLVTDRDDIYERALVLRDHGRTKANHRFFINAEVAFKYRMSNLQAAFGLAQLERVEALVAKKRQLFRWYAERLAQVPGLQLNPEPEGIENTFWMVSAVVDPAYRLTSRILMDRLAEHAIDTRPFFHPLSGLPAYSAAHEAAVARARNRTAYDVSPRGVNLPSALMLTEDHVDRVCAVFRAILAEAGG